MTLINFSVKQYRFKQCNRVLGVLQWIASMCALTWTENQATRQRQKTHWQRKGEYEDFKPSWTERSKTESSLTRDFIRPLHPLVLIQIPAPITFHIIYMQLAGKELTIFQAVSLWSYFLHSVETFSFCMILFVSSSCYFLSCQGT